MKKVIMCMVALSFMVSLMTGCKGSKMEEQTEISDGENKQVEEADEELPEGKELPADEKVSEDKQLPAKSADSKVEKEIPKSDQKEIQNEDETEELISEDKIVEKNVSSGDVIPDDGESFLEEDLYEEEDFLEEDDLENEEDESDGDLEWQ